MFHPSAARLSFKKTRDFPPLSFERVGFIGILEFLFYRVSIINDSTVALFVKKEGLIEQYMGSPLPNGEVNTVFTMEELENTP